MIHIIDYVNTDVKHMDHWQTVVPHALEREGYEVNVIGGTDLALARTDWNLLGEMYYKTSQFQNLYEEIITNNVSDGDIFIVGDAWNPTSIAFKYIQLVMGLDVTVIGMWRDGIYDKYSKVRTGLLAKPKRWAKTFERSLYDSYDFNCFISEEHRKRFLTRYHLKYTDRGIVTGLPYGGLVDIASGYNDVEKEDIIVLPHDAVDTGQRDIFKALRNYLSEYTFIDCHELRLNSSEYYSILNRAKAVMAINLSESDPTNMYEAMLFGCIPIVPDALIYADLLPERFWYPSHYTQPPFLNFVRGRDFMHERVRDVIDNYESYAEELHIVDGLGDKYFNNEPLIGLLKRITNERENNRERKRRRSKRERKFKRSRDSKMRGL
jgi:hypothetical protein